MATVKVITRSKSASNGKPPKPPTLRFAGLIRVSTDAQEKKGESLKTQTSNINSAVEQLGGEIIEWYGGSEHATPGYEKKEVDRLIADSNRGKFDAVCVAHEDRWSRDNVKSQQGLDTFQANDIRFFVLSRECNLSDPTPRFMLAQHAVIGQYHAANQAKKSIESRIHRAQRGVPASGKMPWGRKWDKEKQVWIVDKDKQQQIKTAANRYLKGESAQTLAAEIGITAAYFIRILKTRCGDTWTETFDDPRFKIHEVVTHKIPRLLDEKTIEAVANRRIKNRTWTTRKSWTNRYLLTHLIFCKHCGHALVGHTKTKSSRSSKSYYRHARHRLQKNRCTAKTSLLDGKVIERVVFRHLFETFGNPIAVEKAVLAAIPNQDALVKLRDEQTKIQAKFEAIERKRENVVDAIAEGTISKEQAKATMTRLAEQESTLKKTLHQIESQLTNVPNQQQLRTLSNEVVEQLKSLLHPTKRKDRKVGVLEYNVAGKKRLSAKLALQIDHIDQPEDLDEVIDGMSFEDKRALVEKCLAGWTSDGSKTGVYISWDQGDTNPRGWKYEVRGLLTNNTVCGGEYDPSF